VQLFYTPPVLVRADEPVTIQVDAACITASGTGCSASVTLAALAGAGGWTAASAPAGASLRFDASTPAGRAIAPGATSGSVAFTIGARARSGASATLGTRSAPLRFYVTDSMPTVRVPAATFGRGEPGRTVLYLPWGTGSMRAGIAVGTESMPLGPSSFAVAGHGVVCVLDALQRRLAWFRGGAMTRSVAVGRVSPDAEVALGDRDAAYVMSSNGGAVDRAVTLRRIARRSEAAGPPVPIARGIPERLAVAAGRSYVRTLPQDEWRADPGADAPLTTGRPLAGGDQLLSVARGRTVRLAVVRAGLVHDAVELSFSTDVGELALAEPDGHGGYVVVVHVARQAPTVSDQYQVVHVENGAVTSTFGVARRDFAGSAALARFRLGPDGALYQLASSSDGVRVVRFAIGGAA
jgi:hypothetical protein